MGCDATPLHYLLITLYSFNSRTPCGVRRCPCAPRSRMRCFNSRTPCGVRRHHRQPAATRYIVSIHAPRVGCDPRTTSVRCHDGCFNSRTPCGVRLEQLPAYRVSVVFQFTHPVWGATNADMVLLNSVTVSIHAPRVGCDIAIIAPLERLGVSIHAPRVGCDTMPNLTKYSLDHVSIHAPRVGCDCGVVGWWYIRGSFNSRTPCGVRLVLNSFYVSV